MRTGGSFFLILLAGCFCFDISLKAQTPKTAPTAVSALCNRDSGANIVAEQISASQTMNDMPQRIGVLIRAADVLWPPQEQKARAAFAEAMELAIQDFRDAGEVIKQEGRLPVQQPDQRFVVIAAIAKRDRQWSRKLSDQVFEEETKAENKPAKDLTADYQRPPKLFAVAYSLLPDNPEAALMFARSSLRYTATIQVPVFLYRLAEVNRALADQFYQQALQAYGESPMEQFLYLSSYPFANEREAGEMPTYSLYKVPSAVTPNPNLARIFIQTLLGRAQQLSAVNIETSPKALYSDREQMWIALNRLEPQVQSILQDLLPALQQARGTLQALLNEPETKRASESLVPTPKLSFDERVEDALKQSDPERREGSIALAIITGADGEPLDKVIAAADKIDDTALRTQVLSRLYFDRTLAALKEASFDEARKLAAKIDELDQRAYLYSRIAADSIRRAKK